MTAAMSTLRRVSFALILVLLPALAAAQSPAQPAPERTDPDVRIDPLQPDFNLAALPTTLRMPAHKLAFRVTHRFTRPLGQGDLSDLVSDLFGFDSGAQIGLDALGALEGTDNLRGRRLGALGAVASRNLGRYAVLYAEPLWVINSNPLQTGDDHTVMLGLGGRLRVLPSIYLVAEVTPRLVGYGPGANQMSFGIESRAGGHLFQLNVSNGSGTTPGQLAGGGISYDDWYIGFNIARKFF